MNERLDDITIDEEEKGVSEATFVISTYMFVTKTETNESGETQS